jgi:cytochrome c5
MMASLVRTLGAMRIVFAVSFVATACTNSASPTPTGTECPSPDPMVFGYTAESTPGCTGTADQCNFGKTFMDRYCINCHDSSLPLSKRNGAPLFHDFDTLIGVIEVPDHIDEQTGIGPKAANHFMPGDGTGGRCPSELGGSLDENCPEPTDEERTNLAQWIACERNRTHVLPDAGVAGP